MKIDVIVEDTPFGYSAFVEDHNAFTTGLTLDILVSNIIESLDLLFEEQGTNVKVKKTDLTLHFLES